MDVLDIIQSDHDAIEALVDKLQAIADSSSDRDVARAAELCGQLAIEIHLHQQSEERVVYRACLGEDVALREIAQGGVHHHVLVDTMLGELRHLRPGPDGKLRIALGVLRDLFVRHARDDEERRLLPLLRAALSDDQRLALGQAILAERERIRPQVERDGERPGRRHAAPPGRGPRAHVHHHH